MILKAIGNYSFDKQGQKCWWNILKDKDVEKLMECSIIGVKLTDYVGNTTCAPR